MGRFVNPDSSAFQVALNSRIYVDKTGLIEYVKVDTATFKNDPARIQNRDDVITYLIHLGYLGYNEDTAIYTRTIRKRSLRRGLRKVKKSRF